MLKNSLCDKLLLVLTSVLVLSACDSNNKLSVYRCDYKDYADTCNAHCKVEKDFKYSFLVNNKEKSVFQVIYDEGEQSGSITHKNCTIFSEKNWDCSETNILNGESHRNTNKMANGIYVSHYEISNIYTFKTRSLGDSKAICAK